MARLPRFVLPGQPQHVIQQGNNPRPTIYSLLGIAESLLILSL